MNGDEMYQADEDASELDRRVMELAARLHDAGWVEEAEQVAGEMAILRETPRNPVGSGAGESLHELYLAMEAMGSAAATITQVIAATFPDDIALGRGEARG